MYISTEKEPDSFQPHSFEGLTINHEWLSKHFSYENNLNTLLLVLRHSWLILNTRTKPFEQLLTRTFLFLLRYDRRWDLTINATKKRRYIQFVLRACQDVIEKRCLLFADAYEPILHINTHTPWIIIRLAMNYYTFSIRLYRPLSEVGGRGGNEKME